ncbi:MULTISPECIES: DUF547 domain-containing protein [Vibrio]|uniref:DUF547 domain-containing protein n=1 Tax=Vibrio casei TaxID=673372 RepID=A0A368LKV7_9VIBR|nr:MULTISPECIES: DUF547 domain-containing protein [Vibrio]RCS72468.1 DUF547 domain-containing protein [Vibrio casei]SJN36559.1 Uncharacterized protein DUF547 [Vibrio casei]HBV75193.1 DUF547 domain-containing protein [Vibrio sp.]
MYRLTLLLLSLFSFSSIAAPKAELWPYWNVSNEKSTQVIDHSAWQTILDHNLVVESKNHLFRYATMSDKDKQTLHHYLQSLAKLDPRQLNRQEQFAYWINLYNALTVKLIIDHYPLQSITKLGGLFSFGPWDDNITTINKKELTLNDIEHRILRPIWKDKRIHYALNCASLGCPNLASNAFTSSNTEALLKQAENEFVNSNKGVNIHNDTVQLSSIFKWYAIDFGGESEVIKYLSSFYPSLSQITKKPSYDYNWALNEKKE